MQNGHLLIMFKWPYIYNNYILKIKTWDTNSGHKTECCLGVRQFIHQIFFQVHNNLYKLIMLSHLEMMLREDK